MLISNIPSGFNITPAAWEPRFMPKEGSFRKNLKNYLARTNFCGYLILQLAKTVLLRNLISGWVEKLKNKISESKK